MFTGLIETVGTLRSLSIQGKAATVTIDAAFPTPGLALGDSVAVNGTCLTVTHFSGTAIQFHALAETLRRTNLGALRPGNPVNLERALRLGDRLGGHLVSGHVDGTARVLAIGKRADDIEIHVELPADLAPFVVMKGSIAINGVSLTVARLTAGDFGVCIIPHTWTHTNLQALRPGDAVNLETDLFGKYILRQQELKNAAPTDSALSMDTLAQAGFL